MKLGTLKCLVSVNKVNQNALLHLFLVEFSCQKSTCTNKMFKRESGDLFHHMNLAMKVLYIIITEISVELSF
jgi:hypothetical protein